MNTIIASNLAGMDLGVQVAGFDIYPQNQWRQATLHYLNGVWSGDRDIMMRPKINFSGVTLRLRVDLKTYYAYRSADAQVHGERFFRMLEEEPLVVPCEQAEVEVGLMRFVRNDKINALRIFFARGAWMILHKTTKRGEFLVFASENLPDFDGAQNFYV